LVEYFSAKRGERRNVAQGFRRRFRKFRRAAIVSRAPRIRPAPPGKDSDRLTGNVHGFQALSCQVATHLRGPGLAGRDRMLLLVIFLGLTIVGQAANVLIAIAVEQFSETISLGLFFAMFAAVFYVAWQIAVRVIDRRYGPPPSLGRAGR
jgi:hypothetical protein